MAEIANEVKTSLKMHDKDTGSSAVQIAGLSAKISLLTIHMQQNKKDFACRRTLLQNVSERKRLLKYLQKTDGNTYKLVLETLNLKALV